MHLSLFILTIVSMHTIVGELPAQHNPSGLVEALRGEDAVARFLAEEKLVEMGKVAR